MCQRDKRKWKITLNMCSVTHSGLYLHISHLLFPYRNDVIHIIFVVILVIWYILHLLLYCLQPIIVINVCNPLSFFLSSFVLHLYKVTSCSCTLKNIYKTCIKGFSSEHFFIVYEYKEMLDMTRYFLISHWKHNFLSLFWRNFNIKHDD